MLKLICTFAMFGFFSSQLSANSYKLNKLTGAGIVQIQIETNSKSETSEAEKSILALQVKKSTTALQQSNWKHLTLKKNLKIVILGDSGCRLKEMLIKNEYQDCNDSQAWPFPSVIAQVVKEQPDLIIHLGDYHYREKCTQEKICEKMKGSIGYGWMPWDKDFFEPAKPAFEKIPWIFVRGNHEDCARAFLGYGKLLATPAFENCPAYEEPDYIQLGELLIVNLDSSGVSEGLETSQDSIGLWTKRFEAIAQKIHSFVVDKKVKSVWLVSHKPFYGLVKMGPIAAPVNMNLKKYLESTELKSKVQLVMAGHIHVSEVIKPLRGPLQFILGNGGTQLDTFSEFLQSRDPKSLGLQSIQTGSPGFGYAVFEKLEKGSDWNVSFKNEKGAMTSQCLLNPEKQTCLESEK